MKFGILESSILSNTWLYFKQCALDILSEHKDNLFTDQRFSVSLEKFVNSLENTSLNPGNHCQRDLDMREEKCLARRAEFILA